METKMRDTSLEAYRSILDKLNEKQKIVLGAMKVLGKCTDKQIAKHLGWEINRVTGRRNELLEKKLIKECDKITDPNTNRAVWRWEAIGGENSNGQHKPQDDEKKELKSQQINSENSEIQLPGQGDLFTQKQF